MTTPHSVNGLYQQISNNKKLRYLDTHGNSYSVADITVPLDLPQGRGLAFLYLDNAIDSISLLYNFLREDWVIALLPPNMNSSAKENLELRYQPNLIFDQIRIQIKNFSCAIWHQKTTLFWANKQHKHLLHPTLKLLLTTSGSTGSPKFVKLSEKNLTENALSILDYLPIMPTDVTPLNLPLFYSYGLSVFTSNSIGGGKIVCTNSDIMQKEFWEEWQRFNYTNLAGVPYVYKVLTRLGFLKKEYPRLRYLTQAGGSLNKEITAQYAQYALDKKIELYLMYGQTEATARMSFLSPDRLIDKLGSIGKPIKNGAFYIDPETTELKYSGPNVFGGYADALEGLQHFDPPAQLSTGDLAKQDSDGFYYITGRLKRIVKLFGLRINLDEIEQLLASQFPGNELVCIGIADKFLTICHVDKAVQQDHIKKFLFSRIHLVPQAIRFQHIESIVRTSNGKIDYHAISKSIQ